ncbi:MAG: hypothetical protein KatS3mg087_1110 [Patescibacteria group bacterium]|nr:MAG: hypothetical protein KatS3mg087_1110 [Patescibacteria group bacterium]
MTLANPLMIAPLLKQARPKFQELPRPPMEIAAPGIGQSPSQFGESTTVQPLVGLENTLAFDPEKAVTEQLATAERMRQPYEKMVQTMNDPTRLLEAAAKKMSQMGYNPGVYQTMNAAYRTRSPMQLNRLFSYVGEELR